jgi:hypothetical protein
MINANNLLYYTIILLHSHTNVCSIAFFQIFHTILKLKLKFENPLLIIANNESFRNIKKYVYGVSQ